MFLSIFLINRVPKSESYVYFLLSSLCGTCSHVLGLSYTLIHYQHQGLNEVPASLSITSLPQQWHKPRGAKIEPRSVVNMILAKAKKQKESVLITMALSVSKSIEFRSAKFFFSCDYILISKCKLFITKAS